MSPTVALLVVVAVLAWPGRSAGLRWWRRDAEPVGEAPASSVTVDEVADASVLLALALQSGRGLVQSLDEVAGVSATGAAEDLRRVAAALRWGLSLIHI